MEHLNALPAGTRLGEYEVADVLGAGGFGITYRAWEDRDCAQRVIRGGDWGNAPGILHSANRVGTTASERFNGGGSSPGRVTKLARSTGTLFGDMREITCQCGAVIPRETPFP